MGTVFVDFILFCLLGHCRTEKFSVLFHQNFTMHGNTAIVTTRWPYRSSVDEWRSLAMTHSLSCRGSPHFLPVATLDGQKFMEVQNSERLCCSSGDGSGSSSSLLVLQVLHAAGCSTPPSQCSLLWLGLNHATMAST